MASKLIGLSAVEEREVQCVALKCIELRTSTSADGRAVSCNRTGGEKAR